MASINSILLKRYLRLMREAALSKTHDIGFMRKAMERGSFTAFFNAAKVYNNNYKFTLRITGEKFTIEGAHSKKVIYYIHGGGFCVGSTISHRPLISAIVKHTNVNAYALNYRLAPEHVFPAALEDVYLGYESLLDAGYEPNDVIVAGDSAGGGLSLSLMQVIKEKIGTTKEQLPCALVLLSPWLDLTLTSESATILKHKDPFLIPEIMAQWGKSYAGKEAITHYKISALNGELSGLPPILLQCGTNDVLVDDSRRLAKQIEAHGGEIIYDEFDGMFHVWQYFWQYLPEARRALKEIGVFVKELDFNLDQVTKNQ